MKETNIDSMKYRTSTHLASVDVDTIIAEKGKCIVTIRDTYYSKAEVINGKKVGENVNGKVVDGYFILFKEDLKPMMVNSGNRKKINMLVKMAKNCSNSDSRNIGNWIGMQIELLYDPNIFFGKEQTGGIVVSDKPVIKTKTALTDAQFDKALVSITNGTFTAEKLKEDFILTDEQLGKL
jgi:hypothetical protein